MIWLLPFSGSNLILATLEGIPVKSQYLVSLLVVGHVAILLLHLWQRYHLHIIARNVICVNMVLHQGLFNRAILQSGAWTHPSWLALEKDKALNISMYGAEKLNCLKDTSTETIECLQSLDVGDLLSLQNDEFFFPPTAVIDGNILTMYPKKL